MPADPVDPPGVLSFAAEQMLAGARRWPGAGSGDPFGIHSWILGLLEHHRSTVGSLALVDDLATLEAEARRRVAAGDPGELLSRKQVIARAASRAGEAGRPVIAREDVAGAILELAVDRLGVAPSGGPAHERSPAVPPDAAEDQLIPVGARDETRLSKPLPFSFTAQMMLDELEAGDAGAAPDRKEVAEEAVRRARQAGRPLVAADDVTRAIQALTAERGADAPPEAARAQEERARSEDARAGVGTAVRQPGPSARGIHPAQGRETSASTARAQDGESRGESQSRVIRVFVSSTFRDMQAERDELVKRVFPQLRKRCESRGVVWGEIDLRWGITDEQKSEGQVLPICLAEIHRCRPFFIGLLGERYGWVPEEIGPELIESEPWLAENRERSVTELEILHGVLNDPALADHAYFYLRRPAYIDSLPEERQPTFREVPGPDEVERLGAEEAKRRAEERRRRLAALKERLDASGLPVRKDYSDPVELGELVLADLTGVIDSLYAEGSAPDPLDREAAEHDAFAQSRFGVYIGRQAYFDRLDAHVRGDGPPLVVLGESGSGKSALLANWVDRYRGRDPTERPEGGLLLHFIGATPASADWTAMIRRILGELRRSLGVDLEIPDETEALRATFANALHQAAARGRVVLVLDALNQLEDRDQAPDLVWLPPEIPANVRLVLSTLPGRPLEELSKRGWPSIEVGPLEPGERKRLIVEYLAGFTKTLSPDRVERIAAAPQAANPLFLRVLLEELRLWGDHLTLDAAIDHYLSATELDDLFGMILARYEKDYERERPSLVRDAMTLLWAARRGLTEAELLDLLGVGDEPLPAGHWSPLFLAAEQALVTRSGYVGFFHDYLRQAVQRRYLPGETEQRGVHLRLADYFADRELGTRKVDELPWQLAEAGAWDRLASLLGDLSFFGAAWDQDPFGVKAFWARIEQKSRLRLLDAYRPVIREPHRRRESVWRVGLLLMDTGHPEEAQALWDYAVEQAREVGDRSALQASLGNKALALQARGELDGALAVLEEQEDLCRASGEGTGLAMSLNNQAGILQLRGHLDRALALLKQVEGLYVELGEKGALATALNNQAGILRALGNLDQATVLHEQEERLCRELGDKAGLQASLGNQALIFQDRGRLGEAMALLKEQERLCRELGDGVGLATSLHNQAGVLRDRGDLDASLSLLKHVERLCRESSDPMTLQRSLGNQAAILRAQGDLAGAMQLWQEQEQLCRQLGDLARLQMSLGNQAGVLRARGQLDGAMRLLKEQERLCRELGDPDGLATSWVNQAAIVGKTDPRGAAALAQEAYALALGNGLTNLSRRIEPILRGHRRRAGME